MNEKTTTNQQFGELLEWLAVECDVAFDRVIAKRAVQEAQRGWPGSEQDRWWKWLIEAGDSVGLRVQVVEFTSQQALQVVREKTLAVHLSNSETPWLLIHRQHRRKFHIITAVTGPSGRWVSRSELATLMGNPPEDELLIWVVVESAMPCQQPSRAGHAGSLGTPPHEPSFKPFSRLWKMLAPERADIWVVLVFALFVGMLALATPLAVEMLVSTVAFGRSVQPVVVLAVILFAFLAFSAIVQAVEKYAVELIQRRLFVRIAGDLAYRLPRIRRDALDGQFAPELANRFFDVVTIQKVVATLLVDTLDLVIVTVVGMIVLALYHPLLLGLNLILVALILFVLFVLGRGGVASSIQESKIKYAMAAWLEGLVRCGNALKYEGGNEFAVEHADRIARIYLKARQDHFRVLFRQVMFSLGLYAVASAVLLGVGGFLVIQGQLSLGQLVAAELIIALILGSLTKVGKHLESFYDLMASVDKLGTLFDLPLERPDGLLSLPENGGIKLRLRDVCYGYSEGQSVLEKISLTVESGASVGICGPSGCGKTTLAELLFGLRRSTFGSIELDGVDSDDLRPDVLRKHVSLVGPIEVIDGTIAENVHLDRVEVDSTAVHESLRQTGLLDDIFLLPGGLETSLIATGSPLSETQLRRLVLARAIAGRPRLLLLDTLLDPLPDDQALALMDVLAKGPWTLLVFSNRRPILEHCNSRFELAEKKMPRPKDLESKNLESQGGRP
ncbi:MAG: ABC transporter ATP-binding protein [Planctomycetes bacterium]|nr:ABC transporter ATP-binding protein [Planctomycetota bacterium]